MKHKAGFSGKDGQPPDTETSQGRLYENKAMMGMDINQQELVNSVGLPNEAVKEDMPQLKAERLRRIMLNSPLAM